MSEPTKTVRRTAAQRLEARRDAAIGEANRLAAFLSSAPTQGRDALSPPAFIADPRLAPALTVWRELAPTLSASNRLGALDRSAFAALCYWHCEWIAAVDDIQTRGYSFMANAIAGGTRPWTNPSVERRDTAWQQILTLSAKFGLTPLDRIALNRGLRDGLLPEDDELPLPRPQRGAAKVVAETVGEPEAADPWTALLDRRH